MQHYEIAELAGLRIDGRRAEESRPMDSRIGFVDHVDGSAYLEHGLNKVLALVVGPHEPRKRGDPSLNDECVIECTVKHAPFSRSDRKKRKQGDRRVAEQESTVESCLRSVIMTDLYLRSQITVVVHVLEADGSLIATILNAVFLALLQAGISMSDMLAACTVGVVKGKLCVDLNQAEIRAGGAFVPMVIKTRTEEIVFMQLDSTLSFEVLEEVLSTAVEGARQVKSFLESTIKRHMQIQQQARQRGK